MTTLLAADIPCVDDAAAEFGDNTGLMVARPGRNKCKWWFTVPEGYYALVQKHGADCDYSGPDQDLNGTCVWPSGIHFGPPWLKVSHLVTQQSMIYDLPVRGCRTQDNVTVQIDVAIIFRVMGDKKEKGEDPENVRRFVHTVQPSGLQAQLRDAQEEAIRGLARAVNHTEVYGLRGTRSADETGGGAVGHAPLNTSGSGSFEVENPISQGEMEMKTFQGDHDDGDADAAALAWTKGANVTEDMKRVLNDQFEPQGVTICQVVIKNVTLPAEIVNQMREKTMVISRNAEQKMTQLSEMQSLDQREEIAALTQAKQEERERERFVGGRECKEVEIRLNTMQAQGDKLQKRYQEDARVIVNRITSTAQLENERLAKEKERIEMKLAAESRAQAAEMEAQCELHVASKAAEAELKAAQNEAAVTEVITGAEGQIAPMVAERNDHFTKKLQMGVYGSLAENEEVIISATDDDDMNTMMYCDAILAKPDREDGMQSRSEVLAEMMMMHRGAAIYANKPQPGAVAESKG